MNQVFSRHHFFSFTGGKKKQLHVGKPDDDVIVDGYDGYDDYDFM